MLIKTELFGVQSKSISIMCKLCILISIERGEKKGKSVNIEEAAIDKIII